MKFSKEQRLKILKEAVEKIDDIPLETLQKAADRIDARVKKYYEDCKKNNVCPLTGEDVYTPEEWDRLMNKRFNW